MDSTLIFSLLAAGLFIEVVRLRIHVDHLRGTGKDKLKILTALRERIEVLEGGNVGALAYRDAAPGPPLAEALPPNYLTQATAARRKAAEAASVVELPPKGKCSKCGFGLPGGRFCAGCAQHKGEHIHSQCGMCQYAWLSRTVG